MFDDSVEWVPASLDGMEPGPIMGCLLASIDLEGCTGHDRVRVLQAHEKMASHYQAQLYRDMVSVADAIGLEEDEENPQFAAEAAAAEVRAALRLTRRAADIEMEFAIDLAERLPMVWDALYAGRIDIRRAKVIASSTAHLPEHSAADAVNQVIGDAGLLTTGQLKATLRRLSIEVAPEDASLRYEQAVASRRVVAEPTESGTTNLFGIDLPPHRVSAGMRRVNQMAQSLRHAGETRTIDQLRADVLLDLLEGEGAPTRDGRGTVDIRGDLATLTELAEAPGELGGYGPVVADIVRQVAEQQVGAEWRFTIVDPDSGQPVATGITRRRPDRGQRREVEDRDITCVFPGCRMPATTCDIDHRIPWAESRTTTCPTLRPSAATTTSTSAIGTDGDTNDYPTANTNGSAGSGIPTPPATGCRRTRTRA